MPVSGFNRVSHRSLKEYKVIALAGRRPDPPDSEASRFPSGSIPAVKKRLHTLFRKTRVSSLVCSAAAGADLLALQVAGQMGLRRRVILASCEKEFKKSSVLDRGPFWGRVFDLVLPEIKAAGDLVEMNHGESDLGQFLMANERILVEAMAFVESTSDILSVVLSEGGSRGDDDVTAAFADASVERGIRVYYINTLCPNT